MISKRASGWLFLTLFFCSGATALIYEVVWSKFLSQLFGSTIYAQTVVLAVFMGGLALGNRLFGRCADRVASPVRVYGFVEVALGLYAFFFTFLYSIADSTFVALGSRVLDHSWLLLGLKGLLSIALLLGPTVLMGGTLPLLVAWLQQNSADPRRRSALFYAINSLGAVMGASLAGFYLVRNLGMVATLQATALANVLIGSVAILSSRPARAILTVQSATPTQSGVEPSGKAVRWAGIMVAITGGVSMGLEVLASRSLSLIFGSSLQSFAIVLIAFILGIGLGGAVMASPWMRRWQGDGTIAVLLLVAAGWIGLLVFNIEGWVEFYRVAMSGLGRSVVGYFYQQLLTGAMAMVILGVPAALLGSIVPLLIRTLAAETASLGQQVGRLLTWNTLGAVAGVLTTAFVLMPQAGLRGSFCLLAFGLAVGAGILSWHRRSWRGLSGAGGVGAWLVLIFFLGDEGWRHVMSSGVFRSREIQYDASVMALRKKIITIDFYEDAADATVSVQHVRSSQGETEYGLRINGKTEASSHGDLSTQLLVGHLPFLARPESQDVFILGLGSGITGGAVLSHGVRSLTIAENCEPVLRAATFFAPWNRGVLTNSHTRIWCEDARTILKLSPQSYDIIISQPSNPWMAGIGSVFSKEYYELAARRLKAGGIMCQWFHVYDMHDGIVELVLRTFGSVFPVVELWDTGSGDIVFLGAQRPWESSVRGFETAFSNPRVREDFELIGLRSPTTLLTRQLASQRTGFAIAGDGPIQTDLFPLLEYEAPRAFFIGTQSKVLTRFDERTWQRDLAPSEKREVLAGLSDELLAPVFRQFNTLNTDLTELLDRRLKSGEAASSARRARWGLLPSAFDQAETNWIAPEISGDVSPQVKILLTASSLLEADEAKRRQGVALIESLLRTDRVRADWSPAYYAALAARASVSLENIPQARTLVQLGLEAAPADEQLAYLARVLARHEQLIGRGLSAAR